jgi:hypothetical protein
MAAAQHYVPQVYLRRFASRRGSNRGKDRIWVYDKATGQVREQAIKNVAHEHGFYDVAHSDGRTLSLDPQLTYLENRVYGAIYAVCADRSIDTVMQHRPQLAYFIAAQMTRTVSFRALLNDAWRVVHEEDVALGQPTLELTEQYSKMAHIQFYLNRVHMSAALLMQMQWMLVHNLTRVPFSISDHPIALCGPDPNTFGGDVGLNTLGMRVHVPLDPRLALSLRNPRELVDVRGRIFATVDEVQALNYQQVWWSHRHVFSSIDDFRLAKRMVAACPALGNPNRPRIVKVS